MTTSLTHLRTQSPKAMWKQTSKQCLAASTVMHIFQLHRQILSSKFSFRYGNQFKSYQSRKSTLSVSSEHRIKRSVNITHLTMIAHFNFISLSSWNQREMFYKKNLMIETSVKENERKESRNPFKLTIKWKQMKRILYVQT